MTHLYTLLVGGTVLGSPDQPDASAIAWAGDIVIAIGNDVDVRSISRGDSAVVELDGAFVLPVGDGPVPGWPSSRVFEVGGPADLAVVADDPRRTGIHAGSGAKVLALVRAGRVVAGALPIETGHDHGGTHESDS